MNSFQVFRNIFLVLLLTSQFVVAQSGSGSDMKGRVLDENGEPLSDSIVRIYTATPRVGPGTL